MSNESADRDLGAVLMDAASSLGLLWTQVALLTWLAPSAPDHPGHVGLGGLLSVIGAWSLAEVTYRVDRGAFPAGVVALWLPIFGLAFPGPDIGLSFPPMWAALALGSVGLVLYSWRLIDLAPGPDGGRDTLLAMWRMGGTREEAVRAMAAELDELSHARQLSGGRITDEEWMDQGLIVEWPDATDPGRSHRAGMRAVAWGVAPVAGILAVAAFTSPDRMAPLDGSLVRIGAVFTGLTAIPALSVARSGRLVLGTIILVAVLTAVFVDGDEVLAYVSPSIALIAAVFAAAVAMARLPRALREPVDRLSRNPGS